jgi:hypothetical protein
MPTYEINTSDGRTFEVEANRKPTTLEAQEILTQQSGTTEPSRFLGTTPLSSTPSLDVSSPISILERLKLSFADNVGREQYLRNKFQFVRQLPNGKFAVGNNPENIRPIDPEGLFNDVLGDLADVVGEIPVIAGQILGTIGGAAAEIPTGPVPTTILGAATGAAGGEAVKKLIGKGLGVNEQQASEMATDIAITGAFGAAGEGLIQASKFAGLGIKRAVAPRIGRLFDRIFKRIIKEAPDQAPIAARGLAKTLNILSSTPEKSTLTFAKYGFSEMNDPKHFNPKAVVGLVDDLANALKTGRNDLGKLVQKQNSRLIRTAKIIAKRTGRDVDIPVDDMATKIAVRAKQLGVLDDMGRINRGLNTDEIRPLKQLLSDLGEVDTKTKMFKVIPGKKITAEKALQLKKIYGDKFAGVKPRVQSVFNDFLSGDDSLGLVGLRDRITQLAQDIGLDDYALANRKFSLYAGLQNQLGKLDPTDLPKMEGFIKRLENLPEISWRDLQGLDDFMVQQLGKKSFLKDIELWNAGQDFLKAKPDILRFGMIAGLLGMTTGFKSPKERLATIGGAALLTTPAGQRLILRKIFRGGRGISAVAARKAITKIPTEKIGGTLLTQLLKTRQRRQQRR